MCASNSHSYTHLIQALGIVRKPTLWVFITSKYHGTRDIGLPTYLQPGAIQGSTHGKRRARDGLTWETERLPITVDEAVCGTPAQPGAKVTNEQRRRSVPPDGDSIIRLA